MPAAAVMRATVSGSAGASRDASWRIAAAARTKSAPDNLAASAAIPALRQPPPSTKQNCQGLLDNCQRPEAQPGKGEFCPLGLEVDEADDLPALQRQITGSLVS